MLLQKKHYNTIESLSSDSKLLILSCSRSGTTYTSRFLQGMGVSFGHEKPLKKGGIGWNLLLNNIFPVNDRHARDAFDFQFVLHQVRNPLKVLPSLFTHTPVMYKCIEKVIGSLPSDPLLRSVHYWVKWNNLCLKHSSFTYKVEDLFAGSDLHLFFNRFLGATSSANSSLSKKTNSRINNRAYMHDLNLDDVKNKDPDIFYEFLSLCNILGYDIKIV